MLGGESRCFFIFQKKLTFGQVKDPGSYRLLDLLLGFLFNSFDHRREAVGSYG